MKYLPRSKSIAGLMGWFFIASEEVLYNQNPYWLTLVMIGVPVLIGFLLSSIFIEGATSYIDLFIRLVALYSATFVLALPVKISLFFIADLLFYSKSK